MRNILYIEKVLAEMHLRISSCALVSYVFDFI